MRSYFNAASRFPTARLRPLFFLALCFLLIGCASRRCFVHPTNVINQEDDKRLSVVRGDNFTLIQSLGLETS